MKEPLFTCKYLVPGLMAITASAAPPVVSLADAAGARTVHVRGINSTGVNERCDEPLFFMPAPLPTTLHGAFVGEFDPTPGAVAALPLTPANCDNNSLLATTTDAEFLAAAGLTDADPGIKNIPLREVPIIFAPTGLSGAVPPLGALPPNPFPPVKSAPNDPITLGKWLRARGHMTIKCRANGSASVNASFRNLVPNGVYSMWGLWLTTPPGAPGPTLVPLPFGGVPNALVPNRHGRATFQRRLALCPMDSAPDGSQLTIATLAFHSNGSLYGGVPELAAGNVEFTRPDGTIFNTSLAPGTVDHDQMEFPITVLKIVP